jgi:hypothetical protein
MIKKYFKYLIVPIFIIILFICSTTYYLKSDTIDTKYLGTIIFSGTLASIFGFIIVLVQISRLQNISSVIQDATIATKNEIMSFLFVSDLSKSIKLAQEIQNYNRHKKFELSIIRMQELKYSLIQIKNDPRLSNLIEIKIYNDLIGKISIDISGLDKEVQGKQASIDTIKMNDFMEVIQDKLVDLDTKLKQGGGHD